MTARFLLPGFVAATLTLASLTAGAANSSTAVGEVAPVSAATRTIVIKPGTRWVNVNAGETVKFQAGGQPFAVDFDGDRLEGDLNQLAPAGALDHHVTAYVTRANLYGTGA